MADKTIHEIPSVELKRERGTLHYSVARVRERREIDIWVNEPTYILRTGDSAQEAEEISREDLDNFGFSKIPEGYSSDWTSGTINFNELGDKIVLTERRTGQESFTHFVPQGLLGMYFYDMQSERVPPNIAVDRKRTGNFYRFVGDFSVDLFSPKKLNHNLVELVTSSEKPCSLSMVSEKTTFQESWWMHRSWSPQDVWILNISGTQWAYYPGTHFKDLTNSSSNEGYAMLNAPTNYFDHTRLINKKRRVLNESGGSKKRQITFPVIPEVGKVKPIKINDLTFHGREIPEDRKLFYDGTLADVFVALEEAGIYVEL